MQKDFLEGIKRLNIEARYRVMQFRVSAIDYQSLLFRWATVSLSISANAATDVIYNLAGQQVEGAKKGLYIINGKKVVKR